MFAGFCVLTVISYSVHLTNGAVTTNKEEEYIPIKFPGPINDVSSRYGSSTQNDVPEECKDKNYCTVKPPDYPQERFNAMFKGKKITPQPTLIIETIGDRLGDSDFIDDCETEITYEPLYKVRSKRGEWHTVIQAPEENYIQKVRLETCKEVKGSCFKFLGSMPDVVTMCKQKFSVWEFLVSDGNNGTEKIKTELPICCSCHYRINDRR